MHLIKRIKVDGFWDTHKVVAELNPDVTFFIGVNGTGKTTLINLIAAALTADFPTLEKLSFKRVTISLAPDENKTAPTITVLKSHKKERPIGLVEYRIQSSKGGPELKFPLDERDERAWLRQVQLRPRHMYDYYRHYASGLIDRLNDLVRVDWLSVHRTPTSNKPNEDRTYESTVDRRLEDISNDLVRYFASLSKQKDEEIRKFQEFIFVSLLEQPSDTDFFKFAALRTLEDQRQSMSEIFQELHVTRPGIGNLIDSFFDRAERIFRRLESDESELKAGDFHILIGSRRIEEVVERWKSLRTELDKIFEQRNRFLEIANSLLQRKKVQLSDTDELVFVTRSGKELSPEMLSSGEKQLLILLSETLLQRQTPSVFIADEPELSLHVTWQERLVPSLRQLNDRSQIIAATHSPDIVGSLSAKTIDMETIIP